MSFSDRGDDSKGWGMKGRFCIDSLKVQQSESSIIWQLVELISKHNHYKLRLAVTLALTDTGGAVLTLMLGYRNLRKLILAPNPNRYSKCYPDPSDYWTFGLSNLRTIKKPPKGKYVIPWEGNCVWMSFLPPTSAETISYKPVVKQNTSSTPCHRVKKPPRLFDNWHRQLMKLRHHLCTRDWYFWISQFTSEQMSWLQHHSTMNTCTN